MAVGGVFWMVAAGIAAVAVALFMRRRGSEAKKEKGESAPLYTSGVFSLIRKSPREAVLARIPGAETIRAALAAARPDVANGTPEQYRDDWRRLAELCITNVERGDKEGIQTYRYAVPEKCLATCGRFGGDAYVTREQLHHELRLIPPFHLGCGCEITPREAGGAGGWSPILPVNGRYDTPDGRIVVRL